MNNLNADSILNEPVRMQSQSIKPTLMWRLFLIDPNIVTLLSRFVRVVLALVENCSVESGFAVRM